MKARVVRVVSPPEVTLDHVWSRFEEIRASQAASGRLVTVDPAVYWLRNRLIGGALTGILMACEPIRRLSPREKRLLTGHLTRLLWSGYQIALAYRDILGIREVSRSWLDPDYLWTVFAELFGAGPEARPQRLELDPTVMIALHRLRNREFKAIVEAFPRVAQLQGDDATRHILEGHLSGLVVMGFCIWLAQRMARGQELTRPADPEGGTLS